MNDLPPPKDDAATDAGSTKRKKPGANDPCSCGSGKKFKKCHGAVDGATDESEDATA